LEEGRRNDGNGVKKDNNSRTHAHALFLKEDCRAAYPKAIGGGEADDSGGNRKKGNRAA